MIRKFFVASIAIGFLLLLGVGLAEIVLRLLPAQYIPGQAGGPRLVKDPDIGYKREAKAHQSVISSCYAIANITTNNQGFRGGDWDRSKDSIVVLGDSFTEGLQVSDQQTASAVLGQMLPFQTLNSGISSFGTVGEREIYLKYLRPLKPKVTVLYFLTANDIEDNFCDLRRAADGTTTKICGSLSDSGELVVHKKLYTASTNPVVTAVMNNCRFCQLLKQVSKKIISSADQQAISSEGYRSYETATSTTMSQAWGVTEQALLALRRDIESDGGKLLIVTVPDYARTSKDWQSELKAHGYSEDRIAELDPQAPLEHLKDIATRDNLTLLTLEEGFLQYRDQYNLPAPYFSYRCDGHWNPLGHYLAAQLTGQYLLEHDYLDLATSTRDILLGAVQTNLQKAPQAILGEIGYKEIYQNGIYHD